MLSQKIYAFIATIMSLLQIETNINYVTANNIILKMHIKNYVDTTDFFKLNFCFLPLIYLQFSGTKYGLWRW